MGVTLKLLVDKESKNAVYAEAGKEFVDFLLGLMEIPLGSILGLLSNSEQIGSFSLGKIYESVKSLEGSYLQKYELQNSILNPNYTSNSKVKQTSVLQNLVPRSDSSSFYSYSSQQKDEVDGYVKGAVAYMVMDDLTITPSSTISSINLFNTKGIKDMGTLQEMIVPVDAKKALELVRGAFQSSTVLTDIFIGKAETIQSSEMATTKRKQMN